MAFDVPRKVRVARPEVGVQARSLTLIDSSVTASTAVDVYSFRRPRLENTACDTSLVPDSGGQTWGVCAND